MYGKICFMDTDVLVNALAGPDKTKSRQSRKLLEQVEQGSLCLITDSLVLAETFYIIEKYRGISMAVEMIRKLLTLSNLEIVSLDNFAFFEALKRVTKYKLKMNDMIHYTIALLKNTSGIYSYDKDFNGLEIKRIEP